MCVFLNIIFGLNRFTVQHFWKKFHTLFIFNDHRTLFIVSECVGWLTTLWEAVVAIYLWRIFMLSEMTPDNKMGWLHNHGLKHIEDLLEAPLKFVCTILCCEKPFTRRVAGVANQKKVLESNRAAKLMMSILVIVHLGTELFQRVLDIPYWQVGWSSITSNREY